MKTNKGYSPNFIGNKIEVPLPRLNFHQRQDVAPVTGREDHVLDYMHYSVVLSKSRRFPYFTATNIDGQLFKKIPRTRLFGGSDRWRLDTRVKDYQWGSALYRARKNDFHKGHMTKREDPQWGETEDSAIEAARSTFYYTNSVPQVRELNSREWRSLESYILNKKTRAGKLRINMFTGPVLAEDDPVFVHQIKGETVQIPVWFWKVIYFATDSETLYRVGFLMSQRDLLLERKIASPAPPPEDELERYLPSQDDLFTGFKNASTYQVNVKTIEKMSGLRFHPALEPYTDDRYIEIILEEVEVDDELEGFVPVGLEAMGATGFELNGIVL